MYRCLHLHNSANALKKYMRAHHTHMYKCLLSHKCTITHTRIQLCSCTHPPIHSLTQAFIHSLTRSHIFTLFNFHSLFVTSMLIQAYSHMLMHILTLTTITRTDSIMRSYNLILSYIQSHTRVHTRSYIHTHTQSVCACVSFGTPVCALVCVIKQMV